MENLNILAVGRHPEIMATIIRLINNKPGWNGVPALSCGEALELFNAQSFGLVLIGAGITATETAELCEALKAHKPGVPIVQHFGGGSGLLYAEIYQALG
jgi:DNA-binding response OmpR family regulator